MKKPKKPGDNISIKTKKNESPLIVEWINSQTNLMDSIRYLIENEVVANGIRNLQNHIPAERQNELLIANLPNGKRSEETAPIKEAALWKKPEKRIPDDDIDDEDIESWT
ncbi:hypothetical protein [Brevibacillus nitrificans]|uniref:hypothetical protein n=1 Tax=Brevibacillus nitrificans TaxID=651560 RepID=UPI0026074957|nr:hypothetical protein [Brevibacillus nitrificans]MED1795434.1 hypothetical protein [Brevibacillus nitrificans]